jgi:hypothetical protein
MGKIVELEKWLCFDVNCCVVVVLIFNGLYVLSTTQHLRKSLYICGVLMIASFKLVWNSVLYHNCDVTCLALLDSFLSDESAEFTMVQHEERRCKDRY